MSLSTLLTQDLTIYRRSDGPNDLLGNPTSAFGDPVAVKGRLEQTASMEITVGQDVVVADWRVFLFPDVSIGPLDRIKDVSDRTFEVVGLPAILETPRGPHHIEAHLRTVIE